MTDIFQKILCNAVMLGRSCRQGDPLSPYIFLIVIECTLEMLRENSNIKGAKVGNVEYKYLRMQMICFFMRVWIPAEFLWLRCLRKVLRSKDICLENTSFLGRWQGSFMWRYRKKAECQMNSWGQSLEVLFANNYIGAHEDNFESELQQSAGTVTYD